MRRFFLGIDPGLEGGLVALNSDLGVADACVMPVRQLATHREVDVPTIVEMMAHLRSLGTLLVAIETLPYGRPGQRGVASAQTMGVNYGMIRGALEAMQQPYFTVAPQRWQKAICPGSGDPKLRSIATCRQAVPGLNLTPGAKKKAHDGLADAACIALWLARGHGDDPA